MCVCVCVRVRAQYLWFFNEITHNISIEIRMIHQQPYSDRVSRINNYIIITSLVIPTVVDDADYDTSASVSLYPGRHHLQIQARLASTLTHIVLRGREGGVDPAIKG